MKLRIRETTRTAIIIGAASLMACASPTLVYGHDTDDDPHKGAPVWFHDTWHEYLSYADDRYAILAVDRNGRGSAVIWCGGGGCHWLDGAAARSQRDLFKHKALKLCRQSVREIHPTVKPDCDIYAIKDKIVWPHASPWINRSRTPAETNQVVAALNENKFPSKLDNAYVDWLLPMAEQGDAMAQFTLGLMYVGESAAWGGPAVAEQEGDFIAQTGAAHGRIMARKGARWVLAAAEQGLPEAQFSAALLYVDGLGVPKDYVRAYAWLNDRALTAGQELLGQEDNRHIWRELEKIGINGACELRGYLQSRMTVTQFRKAQNLGHHYALNAAIASGQPIRDGQVFATWAIEPC